MLWSFNSFLFFLSYPDQDLYYYYLLFIIIVFALFYRHVAARQDNLQCVLLFLTRGARPDIVNGIGQQPLDCAVEGSDCYNAINTTAELRKMTSSAKERTNRILTK